MTNEEDEYLTILGEETLARIGEEIITKDTIFLLDYIKDYCLSNIEDTMRCVIVMSTTQAKIAEALEEMQGEMLKDYHKKKNVN